MVILITIWWGVVTALLVAAVRAERRARRMSELVAVLRQPGVCVDDWPVPHEYRGRVDMALGAAPGAAPGAAQAVSAAVSAGPTSCLTEATHLTEPAACAARTVAAMERAKDMNAVLKGSAELTAASWDPERYGDLIRDRYGADAE